MRANQAGPPVLTDSVVGKRDNLRELNWAEVSKRNPERRSSDYPVGAPMMRERL